MKPFKLVILSAALFLSNTVLKAQTNPAITSWLQNNTVTARHYVSGNPTPINDTDLVNVQKVQYSANWVYINTTGLPSYVTGPFLDGNPSIATNQKAIFKFSLNPTQNTGTKSVTTPGNIGVFIDGVALFDYRDGASWNPNTNALCGGPGNPPCPGGMGATMDWNRDAVLAEKGGFDCAKAHPAMGNYHHHQNPSAFNLDLKVVSNICNLYNAEGLYVIDSTKHSPLIGFAFDGFPIYGAYGYKNADGTGGVVRMKSGYNLRSSMVSRDSSPTGAKVTTGAPINSTYPLGYFREDYKFTKGPGEDYLDVHNGRFCKTPEYPEGIYCYFATVDEFWNSAYPYVVGPTFYGNVQSAKVTSITETVTEYKPAAGSRSLDLEKVSLHIFPNPSTDLIVMQFGELVTETLQISLIDMTGRKIAETTLHPGGTIAFFNTQTVYNGEYIVHVQGLKTSVNRTVQVMR